MMFDIPEFILFGFAWSAFSTICTARSLPEVTRYHVSKSISSSQTATATPAITQPVGSNPMPTATPATAPHSSSTKGVTVATIVGILGGMVVLLLLTLVLALALRNHKKKRYQKMLEQATSVKNGSLTAIVVTREFGSESRSISAKSMDSDGKSVRFELERGG
ncbi:hypothetical protein P154DRAFT_51322 [Amniculicola lignicola CBS 123094]|uniref:Mid2 domain-containing protein n=1 Tax=Amniculicola lignicola CBS 123094 TaxID=1392246 RepID=A0A6A5X1M1_9PLEO|nr:hypothetical protein P154DRAFT_51322 [Amniculicola lignicola CBS 123094]